MSETIVIFHPVRGRARCAPHQLDEFKACGFTTEEPAQVADAAPVSLDDDTGPGITPWRPERRTNGRTAKGK